MLNLIRNELMKIFKRPGTYVMIGLIILLTIVTGIFIKYANDHTEVPQGHDWKAELVAQNENYKKDIEEFKNNNPMLVKNLERNIAINEYRIEHNLSPNEKYTMWGFIEDSAQNIQVIGMFVIIIAAGIVASEFSWGTVKLLLIRPIKRSKILAAKYMTVFIFGAILLAISFLFSAISGALLFGMPEAPVPHLAYMNGEVVEQPMGVYLLIYYGLNSIDIIMLATMAFMISAVFRNNSLAIGISLFLLLMGGNLTQLLALKFDWAKYILFANTRLMDYFNGEPMVEGMTLTFSVVMLAIYFCLFHFLALYIFKKRDVAA
ncbi:ABC transporter permease [Bacillus aquiflavi]|uniref:ABC transporter permease n=1 Tax=Bacillus aquiflavi TaxID=2672567 RepID=A0A6B3VX10_9BACI|nr:ABC transporter permease [Bacillus aquiflavi]MBA4538436.1 ABC transporter permease [Bacillus aquiflavi]NEY82800.1 ABC transporter permease [Bacillus aquiflavi]UAC47364.1 ABC transporter permease [Bacillus aquiflavi]